MATHFTVNFAGIIILNFANLTTESVEITEKNFSISNIV